MNFIDNIKHTYQQGNAVTRLIFINIAVFIILHIAILLLKLFNIDGNIIYDFLWMPAHWKTFIHNPWTLISYMFLHKDFMHIFFNMLMLYWFGRIFLSFFNEKQLYGVYILGGILGGIFYFIAYNFFPYFEDKIIKAVMLGASGSVMAIIVAAATQAPNMSLRLFLLGSIKLKHIAVISVVVSFFGITSSNAGGEFAHLGGALYGYLFVVSLRGGRDYTMGFSRLMDRIVNFFNKQKGRRYERKLRRGKNKQKYNYQQPSERKMTDAEYNMAKAAKMKEIDRILDKIKKSGYGSLSEEEKTRLFDQNV